MLLLLAGCTEYGLDFWDPPEAPRSEPPDPHGTASWVIPDEEEACDLRAEPVAARPEATCDAVGFESFEAVRERTFVNAPADPGGYMGMPIAIPVDGRSVIASNTFVDLDSEGHPDVFALDGASLELVGTLGCDLAAAFHVAAARPIGVNGPPGDTTFFLAPSDEHHAGVYRGALGDEVDREVFLVAEPFSSWWSYYPAVRDIDLDGAPDVAAGDLAVSGGGSWVIDPESTLDSEGPAMWDRTGQGDLSMGIGDGEYDLATGALTPWAWSDRDIYGSSVAVFGESAGPGLLVVDRDEFLLVDGAGTTDWTPAHPAGRWITNGIPAVGDLDGDRLADAAIQVGEGVWFVHAAGPEKGTIFRQYRLGNYGDVTVSFPVLADLDADGTYEAVVWSEYGLFILSATSVAPVYSDTSIGTKAFNSSPLVADIDGDGSAEIVVIGDEVTDRDEFHYGYIARNDTVFVYGAAHGEWARTRPVWNQGAYDITTVRDDGAIVRFPRPSWQQYNAWRAQPAHDGVHPDLAPRVTGACADVCGPGGAVTLTAVVDNLGAAEAPAGAEVVLSTWGQGETWIHEVVRTTLPDAVPVGGSSAEFAFTVPWESWKDARVIDVWGTHSDECDYVNDRIDVAEDPCAE